MSPTDPAPQAPAPELSVVVPCYFEAEVLEAFHARLVQALDEGAGDFEVVYVDDGSRDATPQVMRDLAERDPRVRYLILSRNHGHQLALLAGMRHARGRAVVTMDADLQHPPDRIPVMLERWRQGDVDAVLMVRARQPGEGGAFKRLTSRAFYSLFNRISDVPVVPGAADFRLLDRRQLRTLLACGDQRPFYRGLVWWAGGRVVTMDYLEPPRAAGETKYSLARMVLFALDGLFSFSLFPLRALFLVSGLLLGFALSYGLYILLAHFIFEWTLPGWTSLVMTVLILVAYVSVALAIVGEYVGRIYLQVLRRPAFVVAESNLPPDQVPELEGGAPSLPPRPPR